MATTVISSGLTDSEWGQRDDGSSETYDAPSDRENNNNVLVHQKVYNKHSQLSPP
jgi:hypothetical protein